MGGGKCVRRRHWINSHFSVQGGEENGILHVSKGWFENFKKWVIQYDMERRHRRTCRRREALGMSLLSSVRSLPLHHLVRGERVL